MIVMYAKTIRGRNVMTLYFYEDRLNIISMNAANGAKNDVLSSCGRGTIVPVSTCRTWHRKWLYTMNIEHHLKARQVSKPTTVVSRIILR